MIKLDAKLPINIGDTVWMWTKYRQNSLNFYDRYQYAAYTVTRVEIKMFSATEIGDIIYFINDGTHIGHVFTPESTHFTKEHLFESVREELEALVPKDMRDYLWK